MCKTRNHLVECHADGSRGVQIFLRIAGMRPYHETDKHGRPPGAGHASAERWLCYRLRLSISLGRTRPSTVSAV